MGEMHDPLRDVFTLHIGPLRRPGERDKSALEFSGAIPLGNLGLVGLGRSFIASECKACRVPNNNCVQVRMICRVGTLKRVSLPNLILIFIVLPSLSNFAGWPVFYYLRPPNRIYSNQSSYATEPPRNVQHSCEI
jgi:hypothetical protein